MKFNQKNKKGKYSDEWYTPADLISVLTSPPWGLFDLDPCGRKLRPEGVQIAKKTYSIALGEDGLSLPWAGKVFLNPPFSCKELWLDRMVQNGDGIALLRVATDTRWWTKYVWEQATAVLLKAGRVDFDRPEPQADESSPFAIALVAFGKPCVEQLWDLVQHGKLKGYFIDNMFMIESNEANAKAA